MSIVESAIATKQRQRSQRTGFNPTMVRLLPKVNERQLSDIFFRPKKSRKASLWGFLRYRFRLTFLHSRYRTFRSALSAKASTRRFAVASRPHPGWRPLSSPLGVKLLSGTFGKAFGKTFAAEPYSRLRTCATAFNNLRKAFARSQKQRKCHQNVAKTDTLSR